MNQRTALAFGIAVVLTGFLGLFFWQQHTRTVGDLVREIESLNDRLGESNRAIHQRDKSLDEIAAKVSDQLSGAKELQQTTAGKLSEALAAYQKLQQEFDVQAARHRALSKSWEESQRQGEDLAAKLSVTQRELQGTIKDKTKAEQSLADATKNWREIQAKHQETLIELAQTKQAVAAIEKKLKEVETQIVVLRAELEKAKQPPAPPNPISK